MLLERNSELDALTRAVDQLVGGTGSLVLIEGAAGIGKTRLLDEARGLASARDVLVRSARGGEIEREIPFSVARELFERVLERSSEEKRSLLLAGSARLALLALGPDNSDRASTSADPFAPIHGLYWLLSNLSEEQPVFLAIDDAHWSDPETLRFVGYLARRIAELPVLVVAAVRTGEPDEPAEIKALRVEGELLHPNALSERGVGELIARDLDTSPSREFLDMCARITGGNPFLVTEVLRALRADRLDPDAEAAEAIAELAPETVARYVLLRLGRFGEEAIALARAIAVLGGAPQLRHAAALANLDDDRAREVCDQLRGAEVLQQGVPIDFVHPLVRQAIYDDLSEGERSTLHRKGAEILISTGAAPRRAAPHLLATAPNGDPWVVARLREAAEEAIAEGAHDAARSYMERALQEPPEDEARDRYLLGRAIYEPDLPGSLAVFEAAAEAATDPDLRVAALRHACLAYVGLGNFAEAARKSQEALSSLPAGQREIELLLEAQIFAFSGAGDGWSAPISERIARVASGLSGSSPGECIALQARALDLFVRGEPADQVIRLASRFPPPPWDIGGLRSPAPMATAKILALSGAWEPARAGIKGYVDACREQGWLHGASVGHGALAEVDRLSGRFADAEVEALTALEISRVRTTFSPAEWQARMNLLAIYIARGQLDEATELADSLPMTFGPKEVAINPWPLEMRGYLRLAQGELEGGVEDLLEIGEAMEALGWRNAAFSPWWQEAAWALAALGRTSEAAELVRVGEERAERFGAPHVIGTTLRTRAVLESRKRQIATLRKSASVLEGSGPPHELARSMIELGAALRRDGQRSEAREPLRAALELAHRSGAGGLEQHAREELAAAGSRPRTPFRTGATALTASELRTAKLAAEGLSNPEIAQRLFVTRRTVETHLTHVYEKLQIRGREELEAALTDM